jgi:aspartyl-tRNA(Asn)/glutamyl-tRNA(Gln) amidotransferase subunit A
VVAGNDPRDSTSVADAVEDPLSALRDGVRGMRLGVPREYMGDGLEAGVRERVTEAIGVLEELGATVEEVSLPSTDLGLSTYYIIAPAECSSNLARYDGVRFGTRVERPSLTDTYLRTRDQGFGNEVKRRVMLGTYALSSGYYDAYYRRAQKVRTVIAREFDAVFETVDALVCPTSPKVAFTTGAIQDPVEMYLNDALTIPVNLAGLPGISLPCGFSDQLPVGLQVIAPRLQDARVFRVAAAYEAATEWHRHRAPLVAA